MNLLLDTHAFLWTMLQPGRLPKAALLAVQDQENEIFVSAVSLWEISIKYRLGKIDLVNLTTADLIPSALTMGYLLIELPPEEAVSQDELKENTHFDPFDRMLIWQAISRKLTLVSGDSDFNRFKRHGLKLLWK